MLLGYESVRRLDDHEAQQAGLAVATAILGTLATGSTLLFARSTFPPGLTIVALISLMMFASVFPIYRIVVPKWPRASAVANNFVPAALLVSCGFAAIHVGGVLPLASIYSSAIPLLSVMTCSVRMSVVWSSAMALCLAIGIARGPQIEVASPPPWFALAGGITVLVPTLLSMLLHRRVWDRAVSREREASEQMRMQHQEQRALDKRLSESERSQSLSLMAGRVAHDLNNFLTSIGGHASLARQELADGDRTAAAESLSLIGKAAAEAGRLSGHLLDYTGKRHLTLVRLDLRDRLGSAVGLAQASVDGGSEVSITCDESIWVEGDPTQLDQVIVNLIRNAIQSYESSRRARGRPVRVTLDRHDLTKSLTCSGRGAVLEPGAYARLQVADSGRGIQAELREHLFEPFVTDRPDGRGLGLASVAGIIEAHGGGIFVDSQTPSGTLVTALLPICNQPSQVEADASEKSAAARAKARPARSTILVVDDESDVLEVVARLVQRMGHDVLVASDGAGALELQGQKDPDALIVDVAMPGLDGFTVLEEIRKRGSDVPVVLISGYANQSRKLAERADSRAEFLQKPFSASSLGHALARVGIAPPRNATPAAPPM